MTTEEVGIFSLRIWVYARYRGQKIGARLWELQGAHLVQRLGSIHGSVGHWPSRILCHNRGTLHDVHPLLGSHKAHG